MTSQGLQLTVAATHGGAKPASTKPVGLEEEPFSTPLDYPLYAMRMADFLQLEELRDHNSLRAESRVVALDFDGEHSGAELNFVSHQWLGTTVADPDCAHLKTMQDVFKRAQAGENIFKNDDMWQTFVKGRSKQMEKSQGNEAISKAEIFGQRGVWAPEKSADTFARSVRDGWVCEAQQLESGKQCVQITAPHAPVARDGLHQRAANRGMHERRGGRG